MEIGKPSFGPTMVSIVVFDPLSSVVARRMLWALSLVDGAAVHVRQYAGGADGKALHMWRLRNV